MTTYLIASKGNGSTYLVCSMYLISIYFEHFFLKSFLSTLVSRNMKSRVLSKFSKLKTTHFFHARLGLWLLLHNWCNIINLPFDPIPAEFSIFRLLANKFNDKISFFKVSLHLLGCLNLHELKRGRFLSLNILHYPKLKPCQNVKKITRFFRN